MTIHGVMLHVTVVLCLVHNSILTETCVIVWDFFVAPLPVNRAHMK